MATLLIVLLMAFNMWMVIYLTWERRTGDTTREKNGKDGGNRTAVSEIVGRSRFRMPETKPQTATPAPNAATEIRSEEVDEKDVTFADEAQEDGTDAHRCRIPDEELDEVFTDRRVSDIAGYDGDEEPDAEPDTAEGFTFEDIDLAVRTAKKADATGDERRHAGMVFCEMKGNELFALIERSSEATRRRLDELMDYYLDSVTVVQAVPVRATVRKEVPAVPDNFEDFNIRDYV